MTVIRTLIWIATVCVSLMYFASTSPVYASADLGVGPLPEDVVTAVRLHDSAAGSGRGITFGVPLSEGEINAGTQLVVTTAEGATVPSQWNALATWRTDGSVLHGAMTMITAESGNNGGIYYIRRGQGESGEVISNSDIAASGFDASVSVVVGDSTYSLSAADLLDGTIAPRTNYTHYSGPLSTEIAVGGPLRLNGTGTANTLSAVFYIRAYGNPVTHANVTIAFENTGAWTEVLSQELTSVDLKIGGASMSGFPKAPFTAYNDFRWIKRGWWSGSDSIFVQHDMSYVSDTKLMPNYRSVTMNESALNNFGQSTEWNERIMMSSIGLDSGGAKPELAPYDRYTAAYMVSGDKRAWNAMRALTDEFGTLQSKFVGYPTGAGAVHSRDENTGLPLDLTARGAVSTVTASTYGDTDVLRTLRDGYGQTSQYDPPVAKSDVAHWPSIGYLPYLLTAESCELENVQMSAVAMWINEHPGGHGATLDNRNLGDNSQVRGLAWSLREMVNGGAITPDHHPLRNAMQTAVARALAELASQGPPLDTGGNLGLWFNGIYSVAYALYTPGQQTGVASWMNDWLIWSIGSAYERGWKSELDASGLWTWIAQGAVGRMGTSGTAGYCWRYAPWYAIEVRDSAASPLYTTWTEVYERTLNGPGAIARGVTNPETCPLPGTTYMMGQQTYADAEPTSYGAQLGAALAMAASNGISGADAAWSIYEDRQYEYTPWTYTANPEWAIVPRFFEIVKPKPPSNLSAE